MKPVFFDASAFVALGDDTDQFHGKADGLVRKNLGPERFITSDFVLDETVTYLSKRIGVEKAVSFVRGILVSRLYRVYYVDAAMLATSLDYLSKYADKGISCTDATTIAFMRTQKIPTVFTFDTDFRKFGLKVIP